MEIILLGTGTSIGVPMIGCACDVCLSKDPKDRRLRSSAFVVSDGKKILIDCGPDIRQQLLHNNIADIDIILLTHEHNDHVIGLDDLRPVSFLNNKTIPILAEQRVIDSIKTRFPYLFVRNRFGHQAFQAIEITPGKHVYDDVSFEAIRIDHGGLDILAFKINQFAYVTDAKKINDLSLDQLKKVDLLVINSLQIAEHYKHFNLQETIDIVRKLKVKKAVLTHISHKMGLHKKVNKTLDDNICLAYDHMNLTV